MKTRLMPLLLALPLSAAAGEWGVQVHTVSVHFQQRSEVPWNESNDGFAMRYAFNSTYALQLGHYRNEKTIQGFNLFANYAYSDYTPMHYGAVSVGAFGGLVSGFDHCTYSNGNGARRVATFAEAGVSPVVGLVARYRFRIFNLTARVQPDMPNAGAAAVAFEVGFSI